MPRARDDVGGGEGPALGGALCDLQVWSALGQVFHAFCAQMSSSFLAPYR